MSAKAQRLRRSKARDREDLSRALEQRRAEIEEAVHARLLALSGPDDPDPPYTEGLGVAVGEAVRYGLEGIELGDDRSPPPPPIILAQARMAARAGVSLDTVLRRCFAGHFLLGDFILEEADRCGIEGAALKRLLRPQANLLDRMLATVAEEYRREASQRHSSAARRTVEKVKRLLAGEMVDASGLAYRFDGCHLALCAVGPNAKKVIKAIASPMDASLLLVSPQENEAWGWLGGRRALCAEGLLATFPNLPPYTFLALGETGQGLAGWRLTHRQAQAAMHVAQRGSDAVVRYADVALLASMLQDELLVTSMRQLYVEPLLEERGEGEVALETLRAYFAAGRNISSAAARLGVSRNTVSNRLQSIESVLGRAIPDCGLELEAGLRLTELQENPQRKGFGTLSV